MFKTKRLIVERLERRDLRAAFSSPWPETDTLSLSFVPDGTEIGTVKSDLHKSLAQVFQNSDWQLEVLRAFQTWAIESNSNIALSVDEGQPIGTLGFKQGDIRFGDVRIGAFPMESDVLAVANPYDPFIANTWVGDIFLNSNNALLKSAKDPSQSLYSIMLHEAGHVFGVGHSDDTASPMFPQFQDQNIDANLTSDDIGMLRKLYGTRNADIWEGVTGNQTFQNATLISYLDSSGQAISPEWRGDLASLSDIDFYRYPVPTNTHNLDVHFDAQGISLLTAKLTIMNSQGEILVTSSATDPRNNDIHVVLRDLEPGEMLFLKIEATDASVFGTGAYEILAAPLADLDSASPPTGDAGENEKFFDGEQVLATTPGYVEHTYYEVEGNLSLAHPSQSFRVRSSDSAPDLDNIFTVVVGAENTTTDQFDVTISDAFGNNVPYSVIPSEKDELAIQVVGAHSGSDYVISIAAKDSISATDLATKRISYELEVDFAHDGKYLETIVSETLDDDQPIFEKSFHVSESSQFHFAISASDFSNPNESGLEMQIMDASGKIVASMQVSDGATRTFGVFLNRGDYHVQFSSPNRPVDSTIIFQWSGITTSSPIGPQLRDTIREPVESTLATPLVTLQNYWSPDRLTSSRNEPREQSISRSSDMIVLNQLTLRTKTRFNDAAPLKDGPVEEIDLSQTPATVRFKGKDRPIPSTNPSNRKSTLNTTNDFEQKSTKSNRDRSEATSSVKNAESTPPHDGGATSQSTTTNNDESTGKHENASSFSASIEPYLRWLSSSKSQSVGLFILFLSGIVWTGKRRTFERTVKHTASISPNKIRLNKKWIK